MHVFMYVCMYLCMHVCMCVCVYALFMYYVCMYVYLDNQRTIVQSGGEDSEFPHL